MDTPKNVIEDIKILMSQKCSDETLENRVENFLIERVKIQSEACDRLIESERKCYSDLFDKYETKENEVKELREYADHKSPCPLSYYTDGIKPRCSCGLDKLLNK